MLTQYTGPCIENDFRHQVVAVSIFFLSNLKLSLQLEFFKFKVP